jgi:hypothetical protein
VPEGGTSTTEFSVTVSDGVIDSVSALRVSGDRESRQYQDAFARRVAGSVVGKKLADLNLHALWGASLTTMAFEQFLSSL